MMRILFLIILMVAVDNSSQVVVGKGLDNLPFAVKKHSKGSSCSYKAKVPYAKILKSLKVSQKEKLQLAQVWGSLYAGYLARSAATKKLAEDWDALKSNSFINNPFCEYTSLQQDPAAIQKLDVCVDRPKKDVQVNIGHCQINFDNAYAALGVNYLAMMQEFLDPQSFKSFAKDPSGLKKNYATFHLHKAVARLSSTSKIVVDDLQPTTEFKGDERDLGIIVNLQNNSDSPFMVTQTSVVGKQLAEIAFVEHGMNALNLHTAALQQELNGAKQGAVSDYRFDFYQLDPLNNKSVSDKPKFSVGMYTGQQLIDLLQTLPHEREDVFEMNGRPTGIQHIANLQDWYMVLTQDLTPPDAQTRNPGQRVQAINISKLDGPYLMTMQINKEQVEVDQPGSKQKSKVDIFQPSIVTAQVIQSPDQGQKALPLIILPQFLFKLPTLQMYWMLHATSYIAAITDFKFFGPDSFGSAFEYFKGLGYFDTKHEYRFMIDKYNLLKNGQALDDASWLMGSGLYETRLDYCSDIPQIYTALNEYNEIVTDSKSGSDVNFYCSFTPVDQQKPTCNLLSERGFNVSYDMPYHQLYTVVFSLPSLMVEESVFANIIELKEGLYSLTWTNKKGDILEIKNFRFNHGIKKMQLAFLSESYGIGTAIPIIDALQGFKLVYEEVNNKNYLKTSQISPLDKLSVIQTVYINNYPLTELMFELYEQYQVDPYTNCYLFENNVLPKFLQSLVEEDWQRGIYMVPIVKRGDSLSLHNPGFVKTIFYKSDKTALGEVSIPKKIMHPVHAYNLRSKEFSPMLDIYFSTGILFVYPSK